MAESEDFNSPALAAAELDLADTTGAIRFRRPQRARSASVDAVADGAAAVPLEKLRALQARTCKVVQVLLEDIGTLEQESCSDAAVAAEAKDTRVRSTSPPSTRVSVPSEAGPFELLV